jgi:hypothetical protein
MCKSVCPQNDWQQPEPTHFNPRTAGAMLINSWRSINCRRIIPIPAPTYITQLHMHRFVTNMQELVYSRHGLRWLHVCWHVRTRSLRRLRGNFYRQESMVYVPALYIPRHVTPNNTFNQIRAVLKCFISSVTVHEKSRNKAACTISLFAKDFSD